MATNLLEVNNDEISPLSLACSSSETEQGQTNIEQRVCRCAHHPAVQDAQQQQQQEREQQARHIMEYSILKSSSDLTTKRYTMSHDELTTVLQRHPVIGLAKGLLKKGGVRIGETVWGMLRDGIRTRKVMDAKEEGVEKKEAALEIDDETSTFSPYAFPLRTNSISSFSSSSWESEPDFDSDSPQSLSTKSLDSKTKRSRRGQKSLRNQRHCPCCQGFFSSFFPPLPDLEFLSPWFSESTRWYLSVGTAVAGTGMGIAYAIFQEQEEKRLMEEFADKVADKVVKRIYKDYGIAVVKKASLWGSWFG